MALPQLTHDVFPAAWPGLGLAALVMAAALGPRFGRAGGVAIGLLSVLWLATNARFEGGTLVAFDPAHGLTAGDLAGLAGLLVAAWLVVRGRL